MDVIGTKKMDKVKIKRSQVLTSVLSNLAQSGRSFKQILSMFADALASVFGFWAAFTLRLEVPYSGFAESWYILIILPLATVAVCASLGIYRWVVRTSTQKLTLQLVKATIVSSLILMGMLFLAPPHEINPRSIFILYGMVFGLISIGTRSLWQSLSSNGSIYAAGEPVAIFGAGSAGRQLAQLMSLAPEFKPEFFIDDNSMLKGSTIGGLPVVNGHDRSLSGLVKKHEITRIVLAVPSMTGDAYSKVLDRMSQFGIPVQTTPSITEIVDGLASTDEIRDISIGDLLGRTQVEPDTRLMRKCVEGKSVLVTGGGGSIGSEICRQIMHHSPDKLVILDHSEENLYNISEEIHANILAIIDGTEALKVPLFVPILGSVTDKKKINLLIKRHAVDTIYHAAAYKHVPIVEHNPEEGISVNIFGTSNVLDAAIAHSVSTFVLVSTDKAVRPANVMGASKRVAEMVLQARARQTSKTRICMVRFGNVLGSSGSVVPKFTQQIQSGGPITLTDPGITRYFMTIPEASQLVLQASAIASAGDVFVLDMGQPVKIFDLAAKLIRLHGKKLKLEDSPSGDVEIQITGLRPGEKMYEELFITDSAKPTEVSKILVENVSFKRWDELQQIIAEMRQMLDRGDIDSVKKKVMDLAWSTEVSKQHSEPVQAIL